MLRRIFGKRTGSISPSPPGEDGTIPTLVEPRKLFIAPFEEMGLPSHEAVYLARRGDYSQILQPIRFMSHTYLYTCDSDKEFDYIPTSSGVVVLPITSDEIRPLLPPYLKLSQIEKAGHRAFAVNPSRRILDYTKYKEGEFLFRGESGDTPKKVADLIVSRLQSGIMVGIHRQIVHATPDISLACVYASLDGPNYPSIHDESLVRYGNLWCFSRKVMDESRVEIDSSGLEVILGGIPSRHVVACLTSPVVRDSVEQQIELPSGFLHSDYNALLTSLFNSAER